MEKCDVCSGWGYTIEPSRTEPDEPEMAQCENCLGTGEVYGKEEQEAVDALKQEVERLKNENSIMRAALEKYADRNNWDDSGAGYYDEWKDENTWNGYEYAQAALSQIVPPPEKQPF